MQNNASWFRKNSRGGRRDSFQWSAVLALALTAAACGYSAPLSPTNTPSTKASGPGAPATVTVAAASGTGLDAGKAFITATVYDASRDGVPNQTVTFTASAGTITPSTVTTDASGEAHAIVVSRDAAATVTAAAGSVSGVVSILATGASPAPVALSLSSAGATAIQTGGAVTVAWSITILNPVVHVAQASLAWGDGTTQPIDTSRPSGQASHTYARSGTYALALTARDSAGAAYQSGLSAFVSDPPPPAAPPPPSYTVSLSPSTTTVVAGHTATFTATVTPANGAPAAPSTLAWDCAGDGLNVVTDGLTHTCTYPTVGLGAVTTKATATSGSATGTGTASVTVTAQPNLTATITCTTETLGTATPCNVSALTYGSTALSITTVTKVSWDWGDASTDQNGLATAQHPYTQKGSFQVIAAITATTPSDGSKTAIATATAVVQ